MLVHSQKKNSQGIKKVIVNNKLQCSNCKYLLDISNFYKDNSSATGYRSYCKSCAKRYRREKLKQASTSGIIGIFFREVCLQRLSKKFHYKNSY